jgi:hypothetical protein
MMLPTDESKGSAPHDWRRILLVLQVGLSGIALGMIAWFLTDAAKSATLGAEASRLYPWTYTFFHPVDSNLLNYITLCFTLGSLGLCVYLAAARQGLASFVDRMHRRDRWFYLIAFAISAIVLASMWFFPSVKIRILGSLVGLLLPAVRVLPAVARWLLGSKKAPRVVCVAVCAVLLFLLAREQFLLMRGPVQLMNEYMDIYGETRVKNNYINNRLALDGFREDDASVVGSFLELRDSLDFFRGRRAPKQGVVDLGGLEQYEKVDLGPAWEFMLTMPVESLARGLKALEAGDDREPLALVKRMKELDIEAIKQFYLANRLEVSHQNMGRGQVNHIGHVLNPLNEYQLGKPVKDIYIQYGLGNTFVMKWIMDLFGGVSLQNYYKVYVLYTLYFALFIAMLVYLFKDGLYVLGAFLAVPVCFYLMGYTAYIVAPGIVPGIHFLDVPVLALLAAYLRRKRAVYVVVAGFFALLAVVMNGQFGAALSVSLLLALCFYAFESHRGKSLAIGLAGLFVLFLGLIFTLKLSKTGAIGDMFSYFWTGMFSWPVRRVIILPTMAYLVVSYLFLFWMRQDRSGDKYLYIFVSIYSQLLLLYFYWSGLVNHLPPVLPFLWLQLFLMLFIGQRKLLEARPVWADQVRMATLAFTVLAFILLLPSGLHFYKEKQRFLQNFQDHRSFHWTFDRASVVATIDPRIIQESISLIDRFSTAAQPAIFMLSKYDGLLPFLAHRHSAMPFFDLTSYLFSTREYTLALERIKRMRPRYLFVDTNIEVRDDLWYRLYGKGEKGIGYMMERASRLARYELLRRMFLEVENHYELVERGTLLSVYRLKDG